MWLAQVSESTIKHFLAAIVKKKSSEQGHYIINMLNNEKNWNFYLWGNKFLEFGHQPSWTLFCVGWSVGLKMSKQEKKVGR